MYKGAVSFPHSDVLVFLTGQEEIESMQRILERCRTVMPSSCLDLQVCTLFAALPTEQQKAVFTWTKKVWTAMHCVKGEVYCMCAYCPVTCCCSSAYQCTLLTCTLIIIVHCSCHANHMHVTVVKPSGTQCTPHSTWMKWIQYTHCQ